MRATLTAGCSLHPPQGPLPPPHPRMEELMEQGQGHHRPLGEGWWQFGLEEVLGSAEPPLK